MAKVSIFFFRGFLAAPISRMNPDFHPAGVLDGEGGLAVGIRDLDRGDGGLFLVVLLP